jgi:hypothetical protein
MSQEKPARKEKSSTDIGDIEYFGPGTIQVGKNAQQENQSRREINTGGGAYVEGNIYTGGGDFVGRDVFNFGLPEKDEAQEIDVLFQTVEEQIRRTPPGPQEEALKLFQQLKEEVRQGDQAEDKKIAKYVDRLAGMVPSTGNELVRAFHSPTLRRIPGPVTIFVLERIQEQ